MKLNERQQLIVNRLREQEQVAVEALAELFAVSPQTVRKDLNQLCEAGLARRIHGGVALPASTRNVSFLSRRATNVGAKAAMARACAARIPDGASVFLGIGTSVALVAQALTEHRELRVLTNNLDVASILCEHPGISVLVSGGQLRPQDRDLVGESATDFIRGYRVDYGLIGAGGLDPQVGVLDFDPREAQVSRAILAASRHRILLADSSKWSRRAMVVVAGFEQIDLMITDRLPDGMQELLLARGTQWQEAGGEEGTGGDAGGE